jgi:predicted phage gp36 major capsid-like protein
MLNKLLYFLTEQLQKVLENVGKTLNQNPTDEEKKHVHKVGAEPERPWEKETHHRPDTKVHARGAQGGRNKDAEYFNHPRKDNSSGRQNS